MRGHTTLPTAVALVMLVAACTGDDAGSGSSSAADGSVPDAVVDVMERPRYEDSSWNLLVADVESGDEIWAIDADELSFTGSTRKVFSVGLALDALGAEQRQRTPIHRVGDVGSDGTLDGHLVLVGAGDLSFGARRIDADTLDFTAVDHNDADVLGAATLTPQDPLFAVDDLARQISEAGISDVGGNVVVDDRLFDVYRVPNGNTLITPVILNDNLIDVTVSPTEPGDTTSLEYRPATDAFEVVNDSVTSAIGSDATIEVSDDGEIECIGQTGCSGQVSGDLPADYLAPLTNGAAYVNTFTVEDPNAFVRTALIEALDRNGVTVAADTVAPNPTELLPEAADYSSDTLVASFESPPFSETARLVLKVSLNLGANLSLSLFGLTMDERTVDGALGVERSTLEDRFGIAGDLFDFPTNGSGSPDSQAAPRALVDFLVEMQQTDVAEPYFDAFPIMGVDGTLASSGTDLAATGNVRAKTGTTIAASDDGETIELKARNLAGYIETASGRTLAFALMVNEAGEIQDLEADIGEVTGDLTQIANIIYETL